MAVAFVLLLLFVLKGADGSQIVGGREAVPHSRPYMASLIDGSRLSCGGVLVREDFVLTAAHCAISRQYRVVLGAHDLHLNETTRQEFTAVRSIIHPNYNDHENDIMLLQLNRRAQLTKEVQLIPLKTGNLGPYSKCITAGWGDLGDNTFPTKLQEVNVTTLPLRTCRSRWRGILITSSMVCGTGAGTDQGFCSGDSGGPLVCEGAVAGIVSFSGLRCGDPRTPDVYMKVSSFSSWIKEVLNSN